MLVKVVSLKSWCSWQNPEVFVAESRWLKSYSSGWACGLRGKRQPRAAEAASPHEVGSKPRQVVMQAKEPVREACVFWGRHY